ncbi:hypothetical protein [Arcanobacterium haemolyticum]
MSLSRKVAVIAMCASALVLSSCKVDAALGIHPDKSTLAAVEFHDSDGLMKSAGFGDCSSLFDDILRQVKSSPDIKNIPLPSQDEIDKARDAIEITDIAKGDEFACRISWDAPQNFGEHNLVTETDSTFIVKSDAKLPPEATSFIKMAETFIDLRVIIAMPGDIIRADRALIDGNRAIFTSLDSLTSGPLYVEGKKTGDADFSRIFEPAEISGGIPWWGWIAIGVGITGLIIILTLVFTRKKPVADEPLPYGFTPLEQPESTEKDVL